MTNLDKVLCFVTFAFPVFAKDSKSPKISLRIHKLIYHFMILKHVFDIGKLFQCLRMDLPVFACICLDLP